MPYNAIEDAIRRRFAESKNHRGRIQNVDPFPTRRPTNTLVGGAISSKRVPLDNHRSFLTTRLGGRVKKVPVFEYNDGGQDVTNWPKITYRNVDENFREADYHPGAERRDCYGQAEVTLPSGRVVSGPNVIVTRPQADPINLFYEIRVADIDDKGANDLKTTVKSLFPARRGGYLRVQMRNGAFALWNMLRVNGPRWDGKLDPTLREGAPGVREYARVFRYVVEAYEDTSLEGTLQPTVIQRCLDITGTDDDERGDLTLIDEPGRHP